MLGPQPAGHARRQPDICVFSRGKTAARTAPGAARTTRGIFADFRCLPVLCDSMLILVVVTVVALEIAEIAHGVVEDRTLVVRTASRRVVLVGSFGPGENLARIGSLLVGFVGTGELQVVGPVAEEVEEVDQAVAAVVDDLPECHALHRLGGLLAVDAHLHAGELALLLPTVVGREERSHALLVVERREDETVEIEQRGVVQHFVVADETVVFVAQHAESEDHRHG